jgi:hypothetical protein
MHNYMLKRFSLFMWEVVPRPKQRKAMRNATGAGRKSGRLVTLNATHLVARNGGGGVVWAHGSVTESWERDGCMFNDIVRSYINSHPVSVTHVDDTSKKATGDVKKWLHSFPYGGKFFTTNRFDDNDDYGFTVAIPQGVSPSQVGFESNLRDSGANKNRSNLLMCCCMRTGRANRENRILDLVKSRACSDQPFSTGHQTVPFHEYLARMSNSKFVLSPTGNGFANHRDLEAAVAGAVPVLDGHCSGGKWLFDDRFPAIHLPVELKLGRPSALGGLRGPHGGPPVPEYKRPEAITRAWLEAEYAKLEARRDELDVAKLYWPHWLYRVFLQIPDAEELL